MALVDIPFAGRRGRRPLRFGIINICVFSVVGAIRELPVQVQRTADEYNPSVTFGATSLYTREASVPTK